MGSMDRDGFGGVSSCFKLLAVCSGKRLAVLQYNISVQFRFYDSLVKALRHLVVIKV